MAPIVLLNIMVSQPSVQKSRVVTHTPPTLRFPEISFVFVSSLARSFFEVGIMGMQVTKVAVVKMSVIILNFIEE
jgi:hypothetical protein